jgi:hypothetical protein
MTSYQSSNGALFFFDLTSIHFSINMIYLFERFTKEDSSAIVHKVRMTFASGQGVVAA